jgi:hypothetical protein
MNSSSAAGPARRFHIARWRMMLRGAVLGLACLLAALLPAARADAAVRIIRGPTPIEGGSAHGAGDITVMNERLAFALAIDSPPPYGVPRGALIDLVCLDRRG